MEIKRYKSQIRIRMSDKFIMMILSKLLDEASERQQITITKTDKEKLESDQVYEEKRARKYKLSREGGLVC